MVEIRFIVAGVALASALHSAAFAQPDFPSKTIELMVASGPGSSADLTMRQLAPSLSEALDTPVIVINKPGASGVNAYAYMVSKPADGYLLTTSTPTYTSAMAQRIGGFDGSEQEGLCMLMYEPIGIQVTADSPFKTLEGLISFARENPGKLRVSGGAGAASYARLFATLVAEKAGIEWTWVPFSNSTEVTRAVLGGDLDVVFQNLGAVEGGRTLAVTTAERYPSAPDVPSLRELGYDIGDRVGWCGISIRSGTPDEIKSILTEAILEATKTPQWKEFLAKLDAQSRVTCGSEFNEFLRLEIQETREFYRKIGIVE